MQEKAPLRPATAPATVGKGFLIAAPGPARFPPRSGRSPSAAEPASSAPQGPRMGIFFENAHNLSDDGKASGAKRRASGKVASGGQGYSSLGCRLGRFAACLPLADAHPWTSPAPRALDRALTGVPPPLCPYYTPAPRLFSCLFGNIFVRAGALSKISLALRPSL